MPNLRLCGWERDIKKRKINTLNSLFKVKESNSTIKTEVVAGVTSFFAVVYIIAVNSSILSDAGIPLEAGIIATVLSSFIGCLLVGFIGNAPIVLVPGMGINALFTYTIVQSMGLTWEQALGAVFMSGIIFSIIAFTKLSKIIMEAIPTSLKEAITVGIGILITFIGLQKSGIIQPNANTFVVLGNFADPLVYVTFINLAITLFLFIRNVPGNFLISIILGTIVSMIFGIINIGDFALSGINFKAYGEVFGAMNFSGIFTSTFWVATFSLTLVLVFENLGLLHGQVNVMLKEPKKYNKAFRATAISAITCGFFGTSPTVASIESAAGITAGGKTGLASIVTGVLFLVSLIFIPVIKVIPSAAITPILIIIGGLMIKNITHIDFEDFTEGFPAFLLIAMIPLTFSIVDGMAFGFIAYPILKIFSKDSQAIKVPLYLISMMFLANFIFHIIG